MTWRQSLRTFAKSRDVSITDLVDRVRPAFPEIWKRCQPVGKGAADAGLPSGVESFPNEMHSDEIQAPKPGYRYQAEQ
jgi:hypothetical protein